MKILPVSADRCPWKLGVDYEVQLSFSQSEEFAGCLRRWYKSHVLRQKAAVADIALRGRFLHEFFRRYGQHCLTKRASDAAAWDALFHETLADNPIPAYLLPQLRKVAHDFVSTHEFAIEDGVEVFVEQPFSILLDGPGYGILLTGRIDYLTVDCKRSVAGCTDYKTGARVMDSETFAADLQGPTYCLAAHLLYPDIEHLGYEFDYVGTGADPLFREVTAADLADVTKYYITVAESMRRVRARLAEAGDRPDAKALRDIVPAQAGVHCYRWEDSPCPYLFSCSAAEENAVPKVVTDEDAQKALAAQVFHAARAKAIRDILREWCRMRGVGHYVVTNGKEAGYYADRKVHRDVPAIVQWVLKTGQNLADFLAPNGRKKSAMAKLDEATATATDEERQAHAALSLSPDLDEAAAANDWLAEHPLLVTGVTETTKFAIVNEGKGGKDDDSEA